MAKTDTFACSVITPEQKVLECDAKFVAFPAHDGEMGVLVDRAPIVCKMGIGPLRVEAEDGKHTFFVDEGFAQVVDNRLTILTEQAKRMDELDATAAEQAMIEATALPATDDASVTTRDKAVQRARVQLKMAKRG